MDKQTIHLDIIVGHCSYIGICFVLLIGISCQIFVLLRISDADVNGFYTPDMRVSFMNDLFHGIQFTKLYSWKISLMNRISKYRNKQRAFVESYNTTLAWSRLITFDIPALMLAEIVIQGHKLHSFIFQLINVSQILMFLYTVYKNNDIDCDKLREFYRIITEEEFDSDGIKEDIGCNEKQSILYCGLDHNCYQLIKQYIRHCQLHNHSFDIGYIFYYWDYYKKPRKQEQYLSFYFMGNENDHSGNFPHELYIPLKYTSIKQEIIQNTIYSLNIHQYRISLTKAKKYLIRSTKVNTIKALDGDCLRDPLCYGVKDGQSLCLQNVLSIVLYCDWTKLSTEFSKTFRNEKPFIEELATYMTEICTTTTTYCCTN